MSTVVSEPGDAHEGRVSHLLKFSRLTVPTIAPGFIAGLIAHISP
jgi:hypothetical protein